MTGSQDFTIRSLDSNKSVLRLKSFLTLKNVDDSSDEQKTRHNVKIDSSVVKIRARLIDFTFLFELGFTRFCISPLKK